MSVADFDLSQAQFANVLGVHVHNLSVDELIAGIRHAIRTQQKKFVTYANVHAINLAQVNRAFFDCLNDAADIVFCDGFGVKWGAEFLGHAMPHRYTPPDWIPQLCELCVQNNFSLYLVGSKPGVAESAARKMMADTAARFPSAPALRVVGTHHGYFDKRSDSTENQAVINAINAAHADILLVGFGMPTQEFWLAQNLPQLNVNVALTGGAFFDYISGELKRAPKWMTNNGLEWLGRLIAEPRRMWRRYVLGNPIFIARILRQRFLNREK